MESKYVAVDCQLREKSHETVTTREEVTSNRLPSADRHRHLVQPWWPMAGFGSLCKVKSYVSL